MSVETSTAEQISPASLEAAGYARSTVKGHLRAGEEGFVALWQKRIEDADGTRYILYVKEFTPDFGSAEKAAHEFEAEVQFRHMDAGFSNLFLPVADRSLQDLEDHFEQLWDLRPYVHYSEGEPE